MLISFWDGLFSGAMLVLGSVPVFVFPCLPLKSSLRHRAIFPILHALLAHTLVIQTNDSSTQNRCQRLVLLLVKVGYCWDPHFGREELAFQYTFKEVTVLVSGLFPTFNSDIWCTVFFIWEYSLILDDWHSRNEIEHETIPLFAGRFAYTNHHHPQQQQQQTTNKKQQTANSKQKKTTNNNQQPTNNPPPPKEVRIFPRCVFF